MLTNGNSFNMILKYGYRHKFASLTCFLTIDSYYSCLNGLLKNGTRIRTSFQSQKKVTAKKPAAPKTTPDRAHRRPRLAICGIVGLGQIPFCCGAIFFARKRGLTYVISIYETTNFDLNKNNCTTGVDLYEDATCLRYLGATVLFVVIHERRYSLQKII